MQSSSLENFGKELISSVRDKTYGQYLLDKMGILKVGKISKS